MGLDEIDSKIVRCLMRQGRITWSELANLLGLSAPAAADRVRRLEERGVIQGYAAQINPDQVTFDYLKGRDFAPKGAEWEQAVAWWTSLRSDADAEYDDIVIFDAAEIAPTVTWGITPGQGIAVTESVPTPDSLTVEDRELAGEAY